MAESIKSKSVIVIFKMMAYTSLRKRGYLMFRINELKLQYITDQSGEKTGVVLPIEQFEELLEDIDDLASIADRRDEETILHEDLITELKKDGLLSN
jgi:hypothetical protein